MVRGRDGRSSTRSNNAGRGAKDGRIWPTICNKRSLITSTTNHEHAPLPVQRPIKQATRLARKRTNANQQRQPSNHPTIQPSIQPRALSCPTNNPLRHPLTLSTLFHPLHSNYPLQLSTPTVYPLDRMHDRTLFTQTRFPLLKTTFS